MARVQGGDSLSLVQYWHSELVPAEIEELTATFRDLNPDLCHRVYCEGEAEEFIAAHYTSREVAAFQACAVPAMQADYFRYCAVLALGGIYADADFRCVRPLRGLVETTTGGLLFRREPKTTVINGFFAFDAPGHPLLQLALDVATANIEHRAAKRVHAVTGPWIFTSLAALHRLGSFEAGRGALVRVNRLQEVLGEAIGDFARVTEAFERVRIVPFRTAMDWIGEAGAPLAYKQGDEHWIDWHERNGSIFR
jgi:mannosyltransferase OCH1-like enzyme